MRWNNKYQWHKWFAWYPVNIDGVTVWLENIERRKSPMFNCWMYNLPE